MKHVKSLMEKVHKGQGGFTLIELLIVIAILGVIGAVVALNIGGFFGTGSLQAANTEADNVRTAAFAYVADNGLATYTGTVGFGDAGDLGDYLVGTDIKATYSIDTTEACGFSSVVNVSWPDLTWNDSTATEKPCQWVKTATD